MIKKITLTKQQAFVLSLIEDEKAANTVSKYHHDIKELSEYIGKRDISKAVIVEYKSHLVNSYKPASVNAKLAAINRFLDFIGRGDCRVKPLKIQRSVFSTADRELQKSEYERLVKSAAAMGNKRLALIIQTICSTGIRVSELHYITVRAVECGTAEINCKGKCRTVFLPKVLRKILKKYIIKQKITAGAVFVTRTGNHLNRSNIWRMMKNISKTAGVMPSKVFPHNLRHLFARTYYSREKDIFRLADILGHSSVNTTRIYTIESGSVHQQQIDRLGLVFTTEYCLYRTNA